jgi:hypothetical protein
MSGSIRRKSTPGSSENSRRDGEDDGKLGDVTREVFQ